MSRGLIKYCIVSLYCIELKITEFVECGVKYHVYSQSPCEQHIKESSSNHVLFCLLYKHINNDVFEDFPKVFDHFAQKVVRRPHERVRTFSRNFRKLTKIPKGRLPRKFWRCFYHTLNKFKMISIITSSKSSQWNYRNFTYTLCFITDFLGAGNPSVVKHCSLYK